MKGLFKKFSNKRINKVLRFSRKIYYVFFDLCGEAIFAIIRILRIIPPVSDFEKDSIKSILIIRIDRIGDLILSTPAIRAVRETFPQAKISLLVLDYTKDLVVHNPNIDKLLIYGQDRVEKNYDLSFALHPGFRPNLLTFISGARYRVGYTGWGGGFFLTHKVVDDRSSRVRHEAESVLEVVGKVGCTTEHRDSEVSVTQEGQELAEKFFQEHHIQTHDIVVIMHPGARQGYVRWKKERFAEVADRLMREDKVKIILTAHNKEEQLIKDVASLMHEKPLLAAGFKLTHLVSLIKRANLFLGNATGPMHIAVALKTPVVTLFGVINALDCSGTWGPWGEGHIAIEARFHCPECHPSDCKTLECMESISVEDVLEAARKQLNRKR